MEIYSPSSPADRVLGVQFLQSTPTSENGAGGYICGGNVAHLIYWFQHLIPVIAMTFREDTGTIYWQHVREDNIKVSESVWEVFIPESQQFTPKSELDFAKISVLSPYMARLAVDAPWMEIINGGSSRLLLIAEENINRSQSVGHAQLCVADLSGEKRDIYEWPFRVNPDMPFAFRLPELFPWADVSVDNAFYEANGAQQSLEPMNAVRPWTVEANEIAHFRLELKLNELGSAFLLAENFIRRGEVPVRPSADKFGEAYESGLKFIATKNKRSVRI